MNPQRIQRKRTKGWKMPPNTVYVGRPSKYGNPFTALPTDTPELWREKYKMWVLASVKAGRLNLEELRNKNLACWCPLYRTCHVDILLELANR